MSLFFLLAALLVIVVLALLLPSLVRGRRSSELVSRRDLNVSIARAQLAELEQKVADGDLPNSEFQAERLRIEKDLAADLDPAALNEPTAGGDWMLWPVAASIPVMAGFLYLLVGTPAAITLPASSAQVMPQNNQQMQNQSQQAAVPPTPDLREVVTRIKERLVEEPEDTTGWFMLGRAHMALGEFDSAVVAIRKSYDLGGENPEVMIRLADALAMSQGGSMAGEPEPLLTRALELQPDNPQGLWLLGMAQDERGDHTSAVQTWNILLPLLQGDERSQTEVRQLIATAEQSIANNDSTAMPQSTQAATQTTPQAELQTAAPAKLSVAVSVKNGLTDSLSADTAVFIYAKAAEGPPMPLAVVRKTLGELPVTVELSDEDAMIPAMKLSAFDNIIVGARVSLTGNAIAQSGDFYSEVSDIDSQESELLSIIIDAVKE